MARRTCPECERLNASCVLHSRTRRIRAIQVYPSKKKALPNPKKYFGSLRPRERLMLNETFQTNLASLLSQAPAGLSVQDAETLLRGQNGSVRKALKAAKRQLAAIDPTICEPVPDIIDTNTGNLVHFKNLRNVQNSCFMAATITACFAHWDAWDALLTAPQDDKKNEELRDVLRTIVNGIRRNKERVTTAQVKKLRQYILPGYRQEDAGEFFEQLLSKLSGPMLPFGVNIKHTAIREDGDQSTEALRTMDMTFDAQTINSTPNIPFSLADLLHDFFFGEKRSGLRRKFTDRENIVDAWVQRCLLPEYTPHYDPELTSNSSATGEGNRNLRRNSFDTLALPIRLKRYSYNPRSGRVEKIRNPVQLPVNLDFSQFVSNNNGGTEKYSLKLKSVVCHRGSNLGSGHYVSYTYDLAAGWTLWDDCSNEIAEKCAGNITGDGLPVNERWREEISRDSYLVFYELLPGDGNKHPRDVLDASLSGEISDLSASTSGGIMESIVEKVRYDDEQCARLLQENLDREYAQFIDDEAEARRVMADEDAQYARDVSRRDANRSQNEDAEMARTLQNHYDSIDNSNLPTGSNSPPPPFDRSGRRGWR